MANPLDKLVLFVDNGGGNAYISRNDIDDGNIYYDMKGCAMCMGF